MLPDVAQRIVRGALKLATPWGLTCAEFEEFILDYFEGDLATRERRIFEWHLKFCPECRAYLARYRRTIELGRQAFLDPEDPVPSDVPEDLVRAVRAARTADGEQTEQED